MAVLLLVFGLIFFVGLVVIHEFGHFIAARRNGVEVEEFGIGFPPKLWKKRIHSPKGDYDFTINLLPLGGFVRLKGENDSARADGSFGAASLKSKVKIMLAGVGMNLIGAFILLMFAALVGLPKVIDNQFTVHSDTKIIRQELYAGYVEKNSPAEKAGLQPKDRLLRLAPNDSSGSTTAKELYKSSDLIEFTKQHQGQAVTVSIERDGQEKQLQAFLRSHEEVEEFNSQNHCNDESYPREDRECIGYLGVVPGEFKLQRSTWSAPIVAGGLIKQFTQATFSGLGKALAGVFRGDGQAASEQVSGPVGIFVILRDGSLLGFEFILMIIAVISLTLAIMNTLPIPALDGGRLFVTLLFRALKKPLTKEMEERIHGTGFLLLMALFILITVVDVRRFF